MEGERERTLKKEIKRESDEGEKERKIEERRDEE
jgi:hypothetical protein